MTTQHTSQGTRVHNPTSPCSCWIKRDGNVERIVYCPTHAAAPELMAALVQIERISDSMVRRIAGAAIRKTEGANR